LLAKLYRDDHLRSRNIMRFQGATLSEPYVNVSVHTAPERALGARSRSQ